MASYTCPWCHVEIKSEIKFGTAKCPDCERVLGMGTLRIYQEQLDVEHDREQKSEIDAENAWLRAAESSGEDDSREAYLMSIDWQTSGDS